ncbi:MAG: class I SAM-dependent methyltransferase, partial [Lysobacterales bacterium]
MSAVTRETPDIETASDAYAQRFAGAAGRYLLAEQEAAIRALLADWRGGSVLDVGGGHGQLTPLLQTLAREVVVLGSDARGLTRVRHHFPDCATATGDLLDLP